MAIVFSPLTGDVVALDEVPDEVFAQRILGDGLAVRPTAGEVVLQVNRGRTRAKQWDAVLAPAGGEVTLSNASLEPAVVLVTAAPPPTPVEAPGEAPGDGSSPA